MGWHGYLGWEICFPGQAGRVYLKMSGELAFEVDIMNFAWNIWSLRYLRAALRKSLLAVPVFGSAMLGGWQPVIADTIQLKNGGHLDGELLNPERGKDDMLIVRVESGGRIALAPAQVQRVIRKSDAQVEYEKRLPKVAETTDGHWEMAEWCRDMGLIAQRRTHLEKVIAIDPEYEKARIALGYSKASGTWLRPEEFMRRQGYVLHKGTWKLAQQVEIESNAQEWEQSVRDWRKKLHMWLGQLDGKKREDALKNLNEIRDPAAVPPIVDLLINNETPTAVRVSMLDILEKIPSGDTTNALIQISLKDKNDNLRDRCLSLLRRTNPAAGLMAFSKELKSKDNKIVNRAGYCLQQMQLPDATVPLIEALVSSHKFLIQQGGGPGQMSTTFGGGNDGTADGNGLGGLGMGGKPKIISQNLQNPAVLSALTSLHAGVNFGYDQQAWRRWYTNQQSGNGANLRRAID